VNLDIMRNQGVQLPPVESAEGLTTQDLEDLINDFFKRLDKADNTDEESAPGYFLELLKDYPRSMCARKLSEALKLIITIMYKHSQPSHEEVEEYEANQRLGKDASFILSKPWEGYSYEQLGLYFCRSKATIHEAIGQKEIEALQILEDAALKKQAHEQALRELVEEEKKKLQSVKENKGTVDET